MREKKVDCGQYVAPLAGAGIEIERRDDSPDAEAVAPLAGAWIEISC